jgi:hypothetical protein
MKWKRVAGVSRMTVPVTVEPYEGEDATELGIGYVATAFGRCGFGGSIEEAVDDCADKLRDIPLYLVESYE